ncbi:hypothetical protein Xcel_0782 [Xylanimonas cellulosilytica DSM 15894]|uniref:DUF6318 domain-containing protein n=2 Tax=Xylanimonas TaxID=186188 RepID=D1BXL0_XYLCX|nr:hypothetical protein Xcel_0782 [Xylanimonas cellulosilytica DSM 15894]
MQATGDTSEWEAMSHESCGFCAARSEQARQITEAGDTFTGGKTTVSILTTYAMDEFTGIWPIDVQVSESASQITQPDGVVAYSAPASTYRKRVETAQSDGKWVVLGVGEIPEG